MGTIQNRVNPKINNGGFNHKWINNSGIFQIMSEVLMNQSFFTNGNLDYLFANPSDAFVSIRAYPFDVRKYFYDELIPATEQMYLGKLELKYEKDGQTYSGVGIPMPVGTYYKHIGTIKVDRKYNNFLDFAPYTKLELYIPFCQFVTLDTNLVMGKEIRLFYAVDFDSGACTCYIILHHDDVDDLIMTTHGHVGFEIPFGSTNANENVKNMISTSLVAVGGMLLSLATENPIPTILATGISSTNKLFAQSQERISKGGSVGGYQALVNPYNAYLIRTTNIPNDTQDSYAHIKGLPLNKVRKLSTLLGFTKCGHIELSGIKDATSSEINEIEELLQNGVYL